MRHVKNDGQRGRVLVVQETPLRPLAATCGLSDRNRELPKQSDAWPCTSHGPRVLRIRILNVLLQELQAYPSCCRPLYGTLSKSLYVLLSVPHADLHQDKICIPNILPMMVEREDMVAIGFIVSGMNKVKVKHSAG